MRWLDTKVPPPVVLLVMGTLALAIARLVPNPHVPVPMAAIWIFVCAGLALNIIPKCVFHKAGTTINPLRPETSSRLITSGAYRFTRNPMYLGHSLILLGWVFHLGSIAAMATVPASILYVSRFQIAPEERCLSARFPDTYPVFCRQVPRWI
jgi:protein-S-isoprenylcysteine O-methyltransferase Ste14